MSRTLKLLIPVSTIVLATCGCAGHGSPTPKDTNRPSSSAHPLSNNPSSSARPLTTNPSSSAYPLTGDSGATVALTAARVRVATRAVNGGSVSQRDLLQEILGRVDSRLFTQVELTPPPAGYDQFPATDGTWIDFTTAAGGPSGSGPDALIASWEAMIVAGAYRDLSAAACVPASVGLSTSFVRADGTPADISGGDGVLGPVPSSDPADYTEREITQTVESNIGQVGLHLDSIRFIEPNHLVPIVVATTQDPAGFVKHDYSLQSLFGDVSRYEGLCVEVLDTNGAPVEVVGVSNRIDQATRWIRPGLSSPSAGDAYPSPGG